MTKEQILQEAEELYPYLPNEDNDIATREWNQRMYDKREAYCKAVVSLLKKQSSIWFCEQHPESEMGHDGCDGAGINNESRIFMLVTQRRNALQSLKEYKSYYENVVPTLSVINEKLSAEIERLKEENKKLEDGLSRIHNLAMELNLPEKVNSIRDLLFSEQQAGDFSNYPLDKKGNGGC